MKNKKSEDILTVGMYFGPNKIKEIKTTDEKTYLGKEKIILVYDDDKEECLPTRVAKEIADNKSCDLTTLQEKKTNQVVHDILTLLVESELSLADLKYAIGPKLGASINQNLDIAQKILWNGKGKDEMNLMDVEKVIRSADKKK